jgi:SAM-dependent methyltransferase
MYGGLRNGLFSEKTFDAVYLGDVIEHLTDPLETLRDIHSILRIGGVLIVRTPNANCGFSRLSLGASKLMGCQWFASEAPGHLNDFSMKSLVYALEFAEFRILQKSFYGKNRLPYCLGASGYFDDVKPAFKRANRSGKLKILIRKSPMLFLVSLILVPCLYLGRLFDWFRQEGSQIRVIARK